MKKSEIKVLVVDDDITVLRVLEGALKKWGFQPIVAKNIDIALSQVRMVQIHAAIIDCMLPKKSGVDLAVEFRETRFSKQPIILTSGIFKDRSFADEAIQKSGAIDYLLKPLDLDKVLTLLQESLAHMITEDTVPLHKLISKGYESPRHRRKAIESLEEIIGYDLPFVLSVLMDAKVGGHLNMVNESGEIFGISMCKGLITSVDSPNTASTLALNLIQDGFITREDLQELGPKALKGDILKTLLNESMISPHSIPEIRKNQALIEIEALISGSMIKFNFVPERKQEEEPGLSLDELMPLFNRVTEDVISFEYLTEFYKDWSEFPLLKGPQYEDNIQVSKMSLLQQTPGIHQSAEQQFTIGELIETRAFEVDQVYRSIHLLTLKRVVIFDVEKKGLTGKDLEDKIRHMYERVKDQKPEGVFKYFGASDEVTIEEVNNIYKEFVKTNHPDKIVTAATEVKEMANRLFSKVSEAHDILGDEETREKYYKDIKQKAAKIQIEAEDLTQKSKIFLKKNSFEQAYPNLEKAYRLYQGSEVTLHFLWARLKLTKFHTAEILKETDGILKDFESDEKRTALYQFILGLFKKTRGDMLGASACFDKAMTYDPNFLEARRESVLLANQKSANKDLLSADLGEVFGGLFKKKK